MIERVPPQSADTEASVLGGIMLEPKYAIPLVRTLLNRDDFYIDEFGSIYALMLELYDRGIPPDVVAVLDGLRNRDQLDKAGGSGVIWAMTQRLASGANVLNHARLVKEKSALREIIRRCAEVSEECYRQEIPLESIVAMLGDGAAEALARTAEAIPGAIRPLSVIAESEAGRLCALYSEGVRSVRGVTTGFDWMDALTGGYSEEELVFIAGRPNTGKSRVLIYQLAAAAAEGRKVGYISLDMGPQKLYPYLIVANANMHGERITKHEIYNPQMWDEISDARLRDVARAVDPEKRWEVVDEPTGFTMAAIEGYVRRLVDKLGCDIIGIDQTQNIAGWSKGARDRGIYSEIVAGIKTMVRRYKKPIVMLHQINREGANAPTLVDLKDTGCIEEFSDTIIMLHDVQRALLDNRTVGAFIINPNGSIRKPTAKDDKNLWQTQLTPTRPLRIGLEKSRASEIRREFVSFDYVKGIKAT